VTFNENLFCAQVQTLLREIAKRQQHFQQLQQRLRRWAQGRVRGGRPPTIAATQKKIDGWLKARHMKDLFRVELREQDGLPRLRYRFDHREWQRLKRTLLGKTLLFTDLDEETSDAEIVRAYRSQSHVEDAFRTLKDPHHIALRPQYRVLSASVRDGG
jgi:transposase